MNIMLGAGQVAECLGLHRTTVWRQAIAGDLRHTRAASGRLRFDLADVRRWARRKEIAMRKN